jgi:hypothetical protein
MPRHNELFERFLDELFTSLEPAPMILKRLGADRATAHRMLTSKRFAIERDRLKTRLKKIRGLELARGAALGSNVMFRGMAQTASDEKVPTPAEQRQATTNVRVAQAEERLGTARNGSSPRGPVRFRKVVPSRELVHVNRLNKGKGV